MKTNRAFLFILLLVLLCNGRAWAMGEEDFGDKPLIAQNYKDWENIMPLISRKRVYHSWVNGNEQFYYKGSNDILNEALKEFAEVKCEDHEVLLRPGPGVARTFMGDKEIPFNFDVHIFGGIAKHLTTKDKGNKAWDESPVLTVYIGEDIELSKIEIPKGVTVVELSDLSKRRREALTSTDKTVRGWGCGQLASVNPYDDQNLAAIVKMLKDPDNWVRLNAAGAISTFGKKAQSAIPDLREALNGADDQLKERIEKTIEQIEQADDKTEAEKQFNASLKAISEFRKSLPQK